MSLLQRAKNSLASAYDPRARPVLVVESDAGLRAYLVAILERQGYRVVAGGTGEEALERLGDEQALLAVLDLGRPGADCFAVTERLAPDVPVIVVTGDPLEARMKAHGRAPEMTILAKPIAPDAFEAAIDAAL